jgi:endo-1,4-beta-D-glucanase Y
MKYALIILVSLCFLVTADPEVPFPQGIDYEHTIKPDNYTQDELNADVVHMYEYYRNSFLRKSSNTENGYYMLSGGTNANYDTTATVSEAHGYGMLVFALMAGYDDSAKHYFDGMYYFFKDHPSERTEHLMSWEIEGYELKDSQASATDGDLDIAYALLLAHHQWGSEGEIDYLKEARNMITFGIKPYSMDEDTKRIMLGSWDRNSTSTRSSDWMTGHLRAFYWATQDSFWLEAADTVYSIVDAVTRNYAPETGLMPDFVTGSDPAPDPRGGGTGENNAEYFDWNACRYPWRISTDYMHYSTEASQQAAQKMLDWLIIETGGSPKNIKAGYELDGTALSRWSSIGFQAPFGVAATVDEKYQHFLNRSWDVMREATSSGVYTTAINLLSMLTVSGNWWNPGQYDVSIVDDVHKKNRASIFLQSTVNNQLALTVPEGGEYTVTAYSVSGRMLHRAQYNLRAGRTLIDAVNLNTTGAVRVFEISGNGHTNVLRVKF